MGKVVKAIVGVGLAVIGVVTANVALVIGGLQLAGSALMSPKARTTTRPASATTVQLGEVARQAIVGRAAVAGSLVDAFNYGGADGTDWEVLVLALADHRCDALEGFWVTDQYVPFAGDGPVAGYRGQLSVWWRPGTVDQTVPDVLLAHGPGWTPSDNGAGVAHAVVAYKADAADAKDPVWPGGRPRFLWQLRGARCYSARLDSSVGGSGPQRRDDPSTWAWTENLIDCRYAWARGFYACDRVDDPGQLLIGRGLSAIEAPPANVFHRANLCDELVDGAPRYTVGAIIDASATFVAVEEDFAAACAGTIVQPQGSVEIDPGEARASVVTITDDDLVVGSRVTWNNRMLGVGSSEWVNTVVARYIEPALKWADHAAPVRRDMADVIADRQPREERVQLGMVTSGAQAGRIAEIRRRLGRLPGRAQITLPPRFAALEEGDWIVWHSPRRFGPLALTFRVEAWGSDASWHHQLTLRQISASVYSDVAALDDGSVAIQTPALPPIAPPAPGSWSVEAGYQDAGDLRTPVLIVTGQSDNPAARFVRIEYRSEGDDAGPWIDTGVAGPDVQRREIVVQAGGRWSVAISYVVSGVTGPPLVLGPIDAGVSQYADGTPIGQAIERGGYDPEVRYDRGNVVSLPDGSRWRRTGAAAIGDRPRDGAAGWSCIERPARVVVPTTVIGGELDAVGAIDGGITAAKLLEQARETLEATQSMLSAMLAANLAAERERVRNARAQHIDGLGLGPAVKREIAERTEGDAQIVETVDLIGVKSADGGAFILNTGTVRVSPTERLAERLSSISAAIGTSQAAVDHVSRALASETEARASDYRGLTASLGNTNASIGRLDQVIATDRAATALSVTDLSTRITTVSGTVTASVQRLDQAISDERGARTTAITQVTAELHTLARITGGQIVRVDEAIATETGARVSATTQLRAEITGLGQTTAAAVTRLDQAIVDANGARASAVTQLTADYVALDRSTAASVARLDQADADERSARAQAVETLRASVANAHAGIAAESSARVTAVSAEATARQQLGAIVGEQRGFIDSLYLATVEPGVGASAKAVLRLDVNGHVAGLEATNGQGRAALTMRFDSYNLLAPDGSPLLTAAEGLVNIPKARVGHLIFGAMTPEFAERQRPFDGQEVTQQMPGGFIVKAGMYRGRINSEVEMSVVFTTPFPSACFAFVPTGYLDGYSNLRDLWLQNVGPKSRFGASVGTQAATSNAQTLDGFDWIAIGI